MDNIEIDTLEDGTVMFVPERLNRDPIVLRGLTNDELFLVAGLGTASGLMLGIPVWLVTGIVAMTPTVMFAFGTLAVFFGGGVLRRLKRGRPETWLYRSMQWEATCRFNLTFNSGQKLILHNGHWSIRRESRFRDTELKQHHTTKTITTPYDDLEDE